MWISSRTKIRNRRERNTKKSLIIIVNISNCEVRWGENRWNSQHTLYYIYFPLFSDTTNNQLQEFLSFNLFMHIWIPEIRQAASFSWSYVVLRRNWVTYGIRYINTHDTHQNFNTVLRRFLQIIVYSSILMLHFSVIEKRWVVPPLDLPLWWVPLTEVEVTLQKYFFSVQLLI